VVWRRVGIVGWSGGGMGLWGGEALVFIGKVFNQPRLGSEPNSRRIW